MRASYLTRSNRLNEKWTLYFNANVLLELTMNCTVRLLPLLFGDNPDYLFVTNKKPVANAPVIKCETGYAGDKITIWLNGEEVLKEESGTDSTLALACLMAVHYIYSVQYNIRVRNTLLFVQHALVGLTAKGEVIPLSVQRVINEFCKRK